MRHSGFDQQVREFYRFSQWQGDGEEGNQYGLAMDPKGRYLYIGVRGMHRVTILDMQKVLNVVRSNSQAELDYMRDDLGLVRDYLVARVPVGLGPSSVCLSPDGKF